MSALTLTHNLIASKVVTKADPSLGQVWQTIYDIAIKSPKASDAIADSVLQEQAIEIREEAINVVREFISTFNGMSI